MTRLREWARRHQHDARGAARTILDQKWSSLSTWGAMGIALGLPIFLFSFLSQLADYEGEWQGQAKVSVYLIEAATAEQANQLVKDTANIPGVMAVNLIAREEALQEFAEKTGMVDLLNAFDDNPLPIIIEITPNRGDGMAVESVRQRLGGHPLVEDVIFDEAWMRRLEAMMETATRLIATLGIVMCIGVVLIISSILRLAIESRRVEIEVQKLIGATNAFVRRPFLYFGLLHGAGGALVAGILVQGALAYLAAPIEVLAQSYRSGFALQGMPLTQLVNLTLFGGVLGLMSAWVATGRHLKNVEPN